MKRFLTLFLAVLMVLSTLALASCGAEKTLKFGTATITAVGSNSDATAEKNGGSESDACFAAVLVDNDGKIVKCVIDVAQCKTAHTVDGKFVDQGEYQTKDEKKENYGMSKIGKAEWYVQKDSFCNLVVGKTVDEVAAFIAADGSVAEAVTSAGCTIKIGDFVAAVKKAVAAAVDSSAVASDTVKIGAVSELSGKDASEDKAGSNQVDTTVVFTVVGVDGKVKEVVADCVQYKFSFDANGKNTFDTTKTILTKKELGDDYGMAKRSGGKEWYEQAAAFEAACKGKTATEIAALVADGGKGVESLINAGCTITVDALVGAAVKAATVG